MSEFANIPELEKRLWDAADELRAKANLIPLKQQRDMLLPKLISGQIKL